MDEPGRISIIKIKKDEYLIPRSQKVGEIFADGDEITCVVGIIKQENKEKKMKNKRKAKQQKIMEKVKA